MQQRPTLADGISIMYKRSLSSLSSACFVVVSDGCFFQLVDIPASAVAMDAQIPQLRHQRVWWFQDAGLRKLYFLILVAVLSSATNGYDGSMMNGLQALTYWKTCESVVSPMGHTTTDNDQTSTIHMVQSKGCSMQFSPLGLYVRCQLHRTWQIGLADRRVSSLEVS